MRTIASLIVIALLTGTISAAFAAEQVTVSGSTTVFPLAAICAEEFNAQQSDYNVIVSGGGSGAGITNAGEGRSDIAMASREIKSEEKEKYETAQNQFQEFMVGYDGICVAVSSDVYDTVKELNKEQLKEIYLGEIDNWKDVGGEDQEIYVIARKAGSGTRDTFNEDILGSKDVETPGVDTEVEGNAEMKSSIIGSDSAIGYLGFSYLEGDGLNALVIDGVEPTIDTIKNKDYLMARTMYFYTLGEPTPGAQAFIDFVLSDEGMVLAEENGFIPL